MLDLAAILILAQTCAPYSAPETLAAVAWTESRFDSLAIGVNRYLGKPYQESELLDSIQALVTAHA